MDPGGDGSIPHADCCVLVHGPPPTLKARWGCIAGWVTFTRTKEDTLARCANTQAGACESARGSERAALGEVGGSPGFRLLLK